MGHMGHSWSSIRQHSHPDTWPNLREVEVDSHFKIIFKDVFVYIVIGRQTHQEIS